MRLWDWMRAKNFARRARYLRDRGYEPLAEAEAKIPSTGTHAVYRHAGSRRLRDEIVRDGEVIYSRSYDNKGGILSITAVDNDNVLYHWGDFGRNPHFVTSQSPGRRTTSFKPGVGLYDEGLYPAAKELREGREPLFSQLPQIHITAPDANSDLCIRPVRVRRYAIAHGYVKVETRPATLG